MTDAGKVIGHSLLRILCIMENYWQNQGFNNRYTNPSKILEFTYSSPLQLSLRIATAPPHLMLTDLQSKLLRQQMLKHHCQSLWAGALIRTAGEPAPPAPRTPAPCTRTALGCINPFLDEFLTCIHSSRLSLLQKHGA